jgi:hypothetical protein
MPWHGMRRDSGGVDLHDGSRDVPVGSISSEIAPEWSNPSLASEGASHTRPSSPPPARLTAQRNPVQTPRDMTS